MDAAESKLLRKYISDAIANSHSAIKNCWLIMFTGGTVAALNALNGTLRCHGIFDGGNIVSCGDKYLALNHIILFVIYFLTFTRFYLGDIRIFDKRYLEIFKLVEHDIESNGTIEGLARFRDLLASNDLTIFKWEVLWLLFQTLIVVFLAFQIDIPRNFFMLYVILLISNSIWLIIQNIFSEPIVNKLTLQIFPHMKNGEYSKKTAFRRYASYYWISNNFIHGALLCASILLIGRLNFKDASIILSFVSSALCLSNCLFDFVLTGNFYFPKFSDDFYAFEADIASKVKTGHDVTS